MNDELLIRFLLKETTAEEDVLVQSWLDESPENREYFARFEKIWSISKNLEAGSKVDEEEAWAKFKAKATAGTAVVKPISKAEPTISNWLRIAAILLIAMGGAWSVYSYFYRGYNTLESVDLVTIQTLPDGSEVTLNKQAVLSYPKAFAGDKRLVKLEKGEVFFKVTPDKTKPFEIEAGDVQVKVVGTSFNVKRSGNGATEVIVETGIVEVSSKGGQTALHPGEKVLVSASGELNKEKNTDVLYNYYRSKEFVADNTPLWRVAAVLNEAYGANIVIPDERIQNLRLTATFREQPLDNILAIISQTFDLRAERNGRQIILKPAR